MSFEQLKTFNHDFRKLVSGGEFLEMSSSLKGVYCFVNTVNNKKYVGISCARAGILGRLRTHFRYAEDGKDTNPLYHSIRKHGRDKFDVYLLTEETDMEICKSLEIAYIRLFGTRVKKFGYNLTEGGDGAVGRTSVKYRPRTSTTPTNNGKVYEFVDPEGNPRRIHNLEAFCREAGLSISAMRHVMAGRVVSHKGYTRNGVTTVEYYRRISGTCFLKSPEGLIYKVVNKKAFSAFIGVAQGTVNGVSIGKKHYHSAGGWTRASEEESQNPDMFWDFDKLIDLRKT